MIPTRFSPRPRGGFTVIELLVVVGIIVILVGLIVAAAGFLNARAAATQTRAVLSDARAAATEYFVTTGKNINHLNFGDGLVNWSTCGIAAFAAGDPATSDEAGRTAFATLTGKRFIWKVRDVARAGEALTKLRKFTHQSVPTGQIAPPGDEYLIDAWDNPIAYVWKNPQDNRCDDFLRNSNSVFFASAGPDGLWGNASPTANAADKAAAADNIYSLDLD